jgi:hypothetical protein
MTDQNQHWVPKLLLKKFTDTDGRVYRLDIQTDELTKPPPKLAASAPGFNDHEIEGRIISFEKRFEKIETRAAPVLKRIIDTRSLAGLSGKGRKNISDFIAAQSFRTEAFQKGLESDPSHQDFGTILKSLWESAFIVSAQIEKRHWALMVIESDDIFYLGDHPIVLQRTRDPKNGKDLGFDVEGVEALMPLSPKCALYMPCPSVSMEIIARYESALSLHRTIRAAVLSGTPGGTTELITAQDIIRRSDGLYKAFTTGAPITAKAPHVENLNYLQCSWASAAVYSNRKDFAFARHVLKNSPQYRSVPKTRIVKGSILVPDTFDPVANGW